MLIIYGSQTGTAEELSGRLAKNLTRYGKKSLVLDPEEVDEDEWNKLAGKMRESRRQAQIGSSQS